MSNRSILFVEHSILDAVAHASSLPELVRCVIAEGMAMRRPLVATRAGGPTEIIADGRTGVLAPGHDAEALAERLSRMLEDPTLAERIAEAACSEVRQRVSAEAHSRLVEQVYTHVLAETHASQAFAGTASPGV